MSHNCFVFVFGINGIFSCICKAGGIKKVSFFEINNEKSVEVIVHEIEDYLVSIKNRMPVRIIIDGIGQLFISKSVLKTLKSKELNQFLDAKLISDLKSGQNSIKQSRIIKADKNEKTNEYILSSITLDPYFIKILECISSSHHKIISFHSSAAELHDIAMPTDINESGKPIKHKKQSSNAPSPQASKKQNKETLEDKIFTYDASSHSGIVNQKSTPKHWTIIVSMLETSGLRIVISVGNSIILTRVKKIVGHSFNETSSAIQVEIENVVKYVEKSSMLPRSKLFMNVFGSRDFVSIIEAISPDIGTINFFLMQDYISTTKNQGLGKEYNYPAILTLAYKVYKQPFIEYFQDGITENKKQKLIFLSIVGVSAFLFLSLNTYSILKFLPSLNTKKDYSKIIEDEKNTQKIFENLKIKIGNDDIDKNLAIAKFYSQKQSYKHFDDVFFDISKALSTVGGIIVDSISFNNTTSNSSFSLKINIHFGDQTKQNEIIKNLKNNQFAYQVDIENINQETGETVLKFTK